MEGYKRKKKITIKKAYFDTCISTSISLAERVKAIRCVVGYTVIQVTLFIGTSDTDPKQGFHCSYPLIDVYSICYQFCRKKGLNTRAEEGYVPARCRQHLCHPAGVEDSEREGARSEASSC